MQSEATYLNILAIPATPRKQSESAIVFSMDLSNRKKKKCAAWVTASPLHYFMEPLNSEAFASALQL